MDRIKGLRCRECGRQYPKEPLHVCEFCFGPLEVEYDYEVIKSLINREKILSRPTNLWRYWELMPIDGAPGDGLSSGWTPFIRTTNLAKRLGVEELYIKDDSVNHPTLSFKDRVEVTTTRLIDFARRLPLNMVGLLLISIFDPTMLKAQKLLLMK